MSARPSPRRDRVLELHEQGLGRNEIAERLGLTVRSVNNAIRLAKRRKCEPREKDQDT